MKRTPDNTNVLEIFTLFGWNLCANCHNEFRRERGWMRETGPYYGGRGRQGYLCGTCAPTAELADAVFMKIQSDRMKRPSAPPAPPRKRSGQVPPKGAPNENVRSFDIPSDDLDLEMIQPTEEWERK